ncbi:hypothetical protein [Robiginitalea marina]|uniref:Uncharacterized protein n=1 Tax=Robiginitalea marina TaxID=2954105 RepID=A0ABT1B1F2_9FLAO|nr:hypothetical protein [Robiginitalea marina]MCO5726026.1 hypothetical protein [Robiginitalea marina]
MFRFFRKMRERLLSENRTNRYLLYAIGEIFLVVIGILIALQVNTWNEKRKSDERFLFGLRELYGEIRSTAYYESTFRDKLSFQLVRIDSILNHPEAIAPDRLPALILLFDENATDDRDNAWKSEYLEFVPGDEKRNTMAKALRAVAFGRDRLNTELKSYNLYKAMANYLMAYDIPFKIYSAGMGYEEFIRSQKTLGYTPGQLERARALAQDPSFIADLMTLKAFKEHIISFVEDTGYSADAFLEYVQQYDPETNFELARMELIGTGMPQGQWATGQPMHRVDPGNENVWEIDQELVQGWVKFRADEEWILDWGKGENDPNMLVFKGGDIPTSNGIYRIRIDLQTQTFTFTPLEITRMELIGTGLPGGDWASGIPMHRVDPGNPYVWEVKQELIAGAIRFRADEAWRLHWGQGEKDPKTLLCKGENIAVSKGHYRIRIDLQAHTVAFTPLK